MLKHLGQSFLKLTIYVTLWTAVQTCIIKENKWSDVKINISMQKFHLEM